jgi:hypothetical protein
MPFWEESCSEEDAIVCDEWDQGGLWRSLLMCVINKMWLNDVGEVFQPPWVRFCTCIYQERGAVYAMPRMPRQESTMGNDMRGQGASG